MPYPNWNPPWVRGWLYDPLRRQCGAELAGGALQCEPALGLRGHDRQSEWSGWPGGLLWRYIKNIPVYRCPLDLTNTADWKARPNKLSTYVQNGAICGYGAIAPRSYPESQFRQDAYMMWEPGTVPNNPGYGYNDGASYPDPTADGGLGTRHGKIGGIVLNISGSVLFVKSNAWYSRPKKRARTNCGVTPAPSTGIERLGT